MIPCAHVDLQVLMDPEEPRNKCIKLTFTDHEGETNRYILMDEPSFRDMVAMFNDNIAKLDLCG